MDACYPLDILESFEFPYSCSLSTNFTMMERRKRLGLKIGSLSLRDDKNDKPHPTPSTSSEEPSSPDSGFSSDDGSNEVVKGRKLERSKTLASAIRSPQKKRIGKRVRFADTLGFDLEKMEYFNSDDDSKPISCFFPPPVSQSSPIPRLSIDNFPYRSESESVNLARNASVCVAFLHVTSMNVTGQIDVSNIAFDKKVLIRYSVDNWTTHHEIAATFSHKIFAADDIDAFNFVISIPNTLKTDQLCEFCVQYTVGDTVFWDNNQGSNYKLRRLECSPCVVSPVDKPSVLLSLPQRIVPHKKNLRRWGRVDNDSDDEYPIPQRTHGSWVSRGW